MTQFTFTEDQFKPRHSVKIDGKTVGTIYEVKNGFYYQPKGSKAKGATFDTLLECKRDVMGDAMPVELVSSRAKAFPFDTETDVIVAIMEARDPRGICAGEPDGAFRHERMENETKFYLTVQTEDNGMLYITRGRR